MSRLTDLYQALDTLKREGVDTGAIEQKIAEREREIITTEIPPILDERIKPLLQEINHALTFRVSYAPGLSLSVCLCSASPAAEEPMAEEPEPIYGEPLPVIAADDDKKGSVSRLRVTFPDGRTVHETYAKDTMARVIRIVGVERVAKVVKDKSMNRCRVPLVGKVHHADETYNGRQIDLGDGYLLFTNTSTDSKAADLRTISAALGLGLIIEEV